MDFNAFSLDPQNADQNVTYPSNFLYSSSFKSYPLHDSIKQWHKPNRNNNEPLVTIITGVFSTKLKVHWTLIHKTMRLTYTIRPTNLSPVRLQYDWSGGGKKILRFVEFYYLLLNNSYQLDKCKMYIACILSSWLQLGNITRWWIVLVFGYINWHIWFHLYGSVVPGNVSVAMMGFQCIIFRRIFQLFATFFIGEK